MYVMWLSGILIKKKKILEKCINVVEILMEKYSQNSKIWN